MDTAGTASEKPPHVHPRPGEESGDSSGTGPSQSTTSEGNALQKAVEACQRGNLPMLESAFDDGVKAGDVDVEGCALLHWAAINNHCHIMERLISRGAAIDMIGGILKSTPLHWAARVGHLNACVVLVKAGARCDIRDTQGYTPLHLAVQNQFIPIIGYFLKHYPQCIDHTDNSGMTSVMWCAFRILDMFPLRLFVRAGADLGKKESLQGNSALHFAAQERNLSAVRELLRGGADCLAPNNQQETPLDFARNSRNARIIKEMELYARRQGKIPSTFCNRITDNQKLVSIFQFIGPGLFLGTFFLFFHFLHPLLALVLVVLMAIPVKLKLDARTIQSSLIPIGITVAEAVTMAATWSWSMHWWVPWWAQLAFLLSILLLAVSLGRRVSPSPRPSTLPSLRCALGDAGVIPPSTQPYDDLNTLIEEKRLGYFCYTCFVNRPNGAKHCSVCDKCVSNFDHHCPWLNACITRRNQREFLLFVLCVGLSSLIFDSACVAFMLRQLQEIHFGEFLYHFSWLVFTFCLAAIHVFLMTSLFCMQSMQIAQGVTTNQRIKGHRGGYPRHGHSHGGHRRMGDEEEGGDAEAHEGGVVFYIRNCLNFCSGSD